MANRHQVRAWWHNYNEGVYFVTACTRNMRHYFGTIESGRMNLSLAGSRAEAQIVGLPGHFPSVEVLNHVVMPNHIHIVLAVGRFLKTSSSMITDETLDDRRIGCLRATNHGDKTPDFHHNSSLSVVMRCLKGGVKRDLTHLGVEFDWQPRFHEHIIRSRKAYDRIMNYVENNVANWEKDCFYGGKI